MTDTTGVASAVMPMGGSVTAVNPFAPPQGIGTSYSLNTFLGVKAGDHLRLKEGEGALTDVTITAPEDTDANTASYSIATPCAQTDVVASAGTAPSAPLS